MRDQSKIQSLLQRLTLKKGQVVKVDGIPVRLCEDVTVETADANAHHILTNLSADKPDREG
jgi:hypothetical protein